MQSSVYSFNLYEVDQFVVFVDDKAFFLSNGLQGLYETDIEAAAVGLTPENSWHDDGDQIYITLDRIEQAKYRFPKDKRKEILNKFKQISEEGEAYFTKHSDAKVVLEIVTEFQGLHQYSLKSYPISYDYCNGLRIQVPDTDWSTELTDRNTGLKLEMAGSFVTNTKWCIPWDFTVKYKNRKIFEHKFNLENKKVVICGGAALGDSLAWIPYYKEFKDRNKIKDLWVNMVGTASADLLREHYADDPHLHFMHERGDEYLSDGEPVYASYTCGLHFAPRYQRFLTPIPVRNQHLPSVVSWQLGMKPEDAQPLRLTHVKPVRLSERPYVCIAGLSTCRSKNWNNITGWHELIKKLRTMGYKVFDIDKDVCINSGGAIDYAPIPNSPTVGNIPIRQRAEALAGADFFVGPSSGLCWLARAVGCPTIMIGGFTLPINEYENPYRAWNPHCCVGCLHDGSMELNRFNYNWCPRFADNDYRKFECTKSITADMVMHQVERLMKDYELNPEGGPRKYMCDLNTHLPMK